MSLAPEQKLTYPLGGPAAQAAFDSGLAGFEAKSFRGLGVFTSTPYEVSDDQDSVQMLQRSTQIGEFYRMTPPAVFNPKEALPPTYMDIMIFDEESDRHVHITFEQALYASTFGSPDLTYDVFKWGEDLKPADEQRMTASADRSGYTSAQALANWKAVSDVYKKKIPNPTETKAAMQTLINLVKNGVWIPIELVICRPFIEHLMLSAVVAVAGRDTGATLFGPADMQISANTSVKTIEGHYTCHTKSVITKPQNVCVMRDIMCSGYVAGCNTHFFGSVGKTMSGPLSKEAVSDDIQNRLAYQDDSMAAYGSMLVFCAPYGDGEKRDQVISITERLLPWEVNGAAGRKDYFPGGNGHFEFYKEHFALNHIHFGEDVRAAENMEFISQGSMNNALCFVGPHRKYNPFSGQYHELVPGQGHFGPDAIPGDARWRRGETVSLKSARDSMVSLEVAAHAQMFMSKK